MARDYLQGRSLVPLDKTRDFGMTPENRNRGDFKAEPSTLPERAHFSQNWREVRHPMFGAFGIQAQALPLIFAHHQRTPTNRNRQSLKNSGGLPSKAWPTNCRIHPITNSASA
jgi:hypothetical protein